MKSWEVNDGLTHCKKNKNQDRGKRYGEMQTEGSISWNVMPVAETGNRNEEWIFLYAVPGKYYRQKKVLALCS